ncbi:rap guanine nucleotide exchange factor 4 isoform X2 [Macrosteles quadrilineatus]|uniref:rap guanine nucleotide exchange factor 4 isoform X2 n=1 Tax=Macrosteles quadrilineatus TaxID=74068 RepID=UPI0023E170D9|nr:rap guanine nucleotide exchange factor 4 isoform X2 [Macrosteles quadrilineatus]
MPEPSDLEEHDVVNEGFGPGVTKCQSPSSPPVSQSRRTLSPDNSNPAEPITDTPSVAMARAGWVLRTLLLNDASCVLRDRKSAGGRLVVRRCASGSELVDWLMGLDPRVPSRHVATGMWQALLEEGVIFHATAEHGFKDKCLLYQFWQDREGSTSIPSAQDIAEAEEHLDEAIQELTRRAPDATLRMILRKSCHDRTAEELETIYEELLQLKPLTHLSNSMKRELAAVIVFEAHSKAGTVLFQQGDEGKSWYIILRGSVDVVIHGKGTVTTLHEGEDFGKLALINNVPRAASIVLHEDNCHFLRVDKESFNRIMRDVEANTVRLKEHGKDVLILERIQSSHSTFKYMVMAGTPGKMLDYLLETRVSSATASQDPALDDFLLTHIVFMPTRQLVVELARHYHMESPGQDREFPLVCKKRVVQFVYRWVLTIRHTVFEDPASLSFIEDLAGEVDSDCLEWAELQEEASLIHHVMSQLHRYQEERVASAGQKWKLPPCGQPISLFSGPTDGKTRTLIRPTDDVIFRVYCADHTFCTLRFPINTSADVIKTSAADKLGLRHPREDLVLVELKSSGEKVTFRDQEISIPTALSLNGRLFVSPKDHLDALTLIPEQENPTEGMDFDMEMFSTKELAYHMALFDWDLFWSVHEYELLYQTFGRLRFSQITANLDVFLRRFNEIQYWVVTELLLTQSLSKRVSILRKMIKLACYCKDYQNLNALFAVVMGLSNVAVSRLSLTWEKLSSKSRKTFTELESLIDPSRNHRNYRTYVGKLQSPVIPFMPLLIKDMTFVHEGNKTSVDGLVNFEKMHMLAQTMRTLRYCRSRHLVLDPPTPKNESEVRSYISCLRTIDNQRVLTSLSQKLEPRRS